MIDPNKEEVEATVKRLMAQIARGKEDMGVSVENMLLSVSAEDVIILSEAAVAFAKNITPVTTHSESVVAGHSGPPRPV